MSSIPEIVWNLTHTQTNQTPPNSAQFRAKLLWKRTFRYSKTGTSRFRDVSYDISCSSDRILLRWIKTYSFLWFSCTLLENENISLSYSKYSALTGNTLADAADRALVVPVCRSQKDDKNWNREKPGIYLGAVLQLIVFSDAEKHAP